jgi:hypothetical protein
LIAQHAVGEPDFQRRALAVLGACIGRLLEDITAGTIDAVLA